MMRVDCRPNSDEYRSEMVKLSKLIDRHTSTLVAGSPQLNWCDDSVQVSEFTELFDVAIVMMVMVMMMMMIII